MFYAAGYDFANREPARGKGMRSTGARSATHPCGTSGASDSHCYFCFPAFLREGSSPGRGERFCTARGYA